MHSKKHIPASTFNQKTMYVKPDPYSFYSIMIIMLEKLFIMPSGKYVLYEQDISWYGLNITLVYVKH